MAGDYRPDAAKNQMLFEELAGIVEVLAAKGIEAIPFMGRILPIQAYGDLGLRTCHDLNFLIHDSDIAGTLAILSTVGFERQGDLSPVQFELIHRFQGHASLFKQERGCGPNRTRG
jgi:hypothetical protein